MRFAAVVLFCLTLVAASTLDQRSARADIVIDLAGIDIEGEYGDPLNEPAFLIQLSPGQVITGISWTDLEYVANVSGADMSRLSELVFSLSTSNPAVYWDFRITNSLNSGSSAGVVSSSGNTSNIVQTYPNLGMTSLTAGADGKIYFYLYDQFDDFVGPDSQILSGKLTIQTVPEPSTVLASLAVAGCGIVVRRLRSKKQTVVV